jgi:hypothetical protein
MLLSFPIFLMAICCGFEISMFAPDPEEQSLILKNERLSAPVTSTMNSNVSMRVLWTISEYKVSEGAVWGEEEARKMLFKPLDIDVTQITFDGKTCCDVIFQREEVDAKKYLDHAYRTTPQALGIEEDAVEVVRTNCDLPGFAEYMRLKDRRLIIYLNGVFFYFKPAVNY